jgi:lipopolysaccharide export system permease protein
VCATETDLLITFHWIPRRLPWLRRAATVRAFMRLLDRYLLRELLLPLVYCLGGFLISFIVFDLFKSIDDFQKKNLTGGDILEYYVYCTPEFLVASYVVPMSLLLGLLYALTNHARHNELTAMRAAAIPLWRIAVPYFAVGIVFSALVFYVNEQLVPAGVEAADRVMSRHVSDQPKTAEKVWKRNVFFLNPLANRTWRIGAYHLQQNVMWNPQFDWHRPDGTRVQLIAERARWIQRQWVFTNVQRLEFSAAIDALPDISRTNQLVFEGLTETPRIIKSEIKISTIEGLKSLRKTQLSSLEIIDYLKLHPRLERKKYDSLRTMLYSRLAAPWICLVVVFIAVPFGALPGRRNVFVGVASSIFICFTFFIMKELSIALGGGGFVPPWVAAWAPNILFAAAGFVLMWRVR